MTLNPSQQTLPLGNLSHSSKLNKDSYIRWQQSYILHNFPCIYFTDIQLKATQSRARFWEFFLPDRRACSSTFFTGLKFILQDQNQKEKREKKYT